MAHTPSRYVPLDVYYARDPRLRSAGTDAELVYIRALAHAKAGETDGKIFHFDIPLLTFSLPRVRKSIAALVRENLWEETDDGWQITGWDRWNPSRADLAKRKKAQVEGAAKTNHRLHRDRLTEYVPTCLVCTGEVPQ